MALEYDNICYSPEYSINFQKYKYPVNNEIELVF